MTTTPTFEQLDHRLYRLSTLAQADLDGYWLGYFASAKNQLGSSASTRAVWEDIGGFYLLLGQTPADWPAFIEALLQLLPNLAPPGQLRCLWISNPDQPWVTWQTTGVQARASGSGADVVWTLQRTTAFYLGAYKLTLSGLAELNFVDDSAGGGIAFAGGGHFAGPGGAYRAASLNVSFSGAGLGAFTGNITATVPANAEDTDIWSALAIGLQYASEPEPIGAPAPENGENPELAFQAASKILFMPVFERQSTALELSLNFDPFNPLLGTRTFLSLFPSGASTPPALSCFLRTTRGYTVDITPRAAAGSLPDARFVFGRCPVRGTRVDEGYRYHLSPDGAFDITVTTPEGASTAAQGAIPYQLLLGLSGLEYASLGNSGDGYLVFRGGQPAFIPAAGEGGSAPDVASALTGLATTSHLAVIAPDAQAADPVYYAQPKQAPIFSGLNHRSDGFLDYNAMPAVTLSAGTASLPPVFPVGIYAGLDGASAALARQMENASLAPYRHYRIGQSYGGATVEALAVASGPERRLRAADDPLGVTPQGLVAELTSDYQQFDGLFIGNLPGSNYPKIDLTAVAGGFKQSLQSNQLFFVAANVDVLMTGTSVRYQLDEADKPYLQADGVPQNIIDNVYAAIAGKPQPFDTEKAFTDCIATAATPEYLKYFLDVAGILKVEMDDWTFQLSPRSWRDWQKHKDSPTLMVAKFCSRSLRQMASDTSSWAWPEVATPNGGSLAETQRVMLDIFNAAAADDAGEPYKIFLETVLDNPSWNGFLFLNAPVDIAELPNDLKFLAAGINLEKFYAHHIGFSQTPFQVSNGQPVLQKTAAFGLIDYVDTVDLYSDVSIPFGFKTMQLRVRFANAALADFSAQVELMLNDLLASPLNKSVAARGNNLIIDGSYQRVGGTPRYAFSLTGQNVFNTGNTVLAGIEILSVQLVSGENNQDDQVLTTFTLSGNLRFMNIPEFDLFSFGPEGSDVGDKDGNLFFSGFPIDMVFSLATPDQQTFIPHEGSTHFDLLKSNARDASLVNNFPLTVSKLIASANLSAPGKEPTGQTPEDMGFTSIAMPLEQTPMNPSWYGLEYSLDLGTLGALTGSVGFKISLLVAWSKGHDQTDPPLYLGLKLPNIPALGGSFPLQGVLKLGFRSFQFETYTTDDNKLGYLLRLRRFALSVLAWSFPPGNTDILLFGEPGNPKGSIGWYAVYDDGKSGDGGDGDSIDAKALTRPSLPIPQDNGVKKDTTVSRRMRSGRRNI